MFRLLHSVIPRIDARRYSLLPPDLEQRKNGACLLVWRDLPYWTVVDAELREVLARMDGSHTLRDALASDERSPAEARSVRAALRLLRDRGVLQEAGAVAGNPSSPPLKIENIAINVTFRCNLRCTFCYNAGLPPIRPEQELSTREMVDLIDATAPFRGRGALLSLLGGEPLLEPDKVISLARHAKRRGLVAMVSTNGLMIDAHFAQEARRCGLQVQVSLDASTPTLHEAVRGTGTFSRTIAGVSSLVAGGAHTILSMVCHRGNVEELGAFYALGQQLGVSEVRFIPLKRIGRAAESGLQPAPLPDLMRKAADLFRQRPEFKRLGGRDAFSILAQTCRLAARRQSCGTGSQTLLLDANGDLYPCINTCASALRIANVRDPGFHFATAWRQSPVLLRIREQTAVDNPANACYTCPVRYWCLGGCRGETFGAHGRLDLPAWNCAEQKAAILEMLWTLAEQPDLIPRARAQEL